MTIRKNSNLWWKITLTVFTLFLVAIVSLNYWAKWRVRQEIEKLSGHKIKGLYSLAIGKTYLDIWNGELQASNISLQSDTTAWNKLREGQPDSLLPLVSLTAQSVHIRHFNWLRYLSTKTAAVRSVVLDHPELRITVHSNPDTAAANVSLKDRLQNLPNLIAPIAGMLKIRNVSVNSASVFLQTVKAPGDTAKQELKEADVYFKDLNINKNATEITYCKEIEVRAKHFATIFNKGNQKISFDDFKLSKNGHQISLTNFHFDPQRTEEQYFKDIGVRRAYIEIKCPEIQLRGIDVDRWIAYDYFYAKSMQLQTPDLNFTIKKALPLPYRKLLPHELVRNMKGYFNIEEVIVKDAYIGIVNRVPGRDFTVSFNHSYITANNFSNDPLLMDNKYPLQIWAESRFMDEAAIKMKMNIPLLSETLNADYTATVDGLSLDVLNPVINHKRLAIVSGYMRSAEVSSVIRNGVATGKVVMQYRGLEIEVMKKDTGKTRKFASKIANMLLNEDNSKSDPDSFITGEISLTRNRQEEYFAFLWHSIQTGLLPTLMPAMDRLNLKPGRT